MDAGAPADHLSTTSSLARRLASMVYELLLAFAIVFFASLAFYGAATESLTGIARNIFQIYLLAVLGVYFVPCWHWGGQTVPMKIWKLRLVSASGGTVSLRRAVLRYLLAWPSIAFAGIGLIWAFFDRDRQFLHDRLARTRIVGCGARSTGTREQRQR